MRRCFSHHSLMSCIVIFFMATDYNYSQTKRIKRPSSRVGIASVDQFVRESFDLYNKVYMYDGYAAAGKPLSDEDIDVLENALDDLAGLSESAPSVLSDLDGIGVLKQGKATLQINRSKKALNYSIKTAKELLLGQREREEDSDDETETDTDTEADNKNEEDTADSSNQTSQNEEEPSNISDNLEVYSKYDFVPGDKTLFFDDFSQDFIGDFPSRWNTNATGEVVKIGDEKWFELKSGYGVYYVPDIANLPEDYTIEFDLLTKGMGKQTSSTARFHVILSDNNKFKNGLAHYMQTAIPLGQYGAFPLRVNNYFNRQTGDINTDIRVDIRDEVLNRPHIAISVTKNRYRLWINEVKYIDIPRGIQELNVLNHIKFHINNFKDGEERVFITNLKVAEGGVDLRRKLLSEGSISTNGILFNSGSAKIQPQSLGIVLQISQVLMEDDSIRLLIVGHTDADGTDEANLKLSKARADAVKQALVDIYNISGDRLSTAGKGESNPVADNSSAEGKAQNRRVEFIKQ
ncbi:MAG: OmpA family protein [Bacteroidia bacterium]|nr:OmpA family protein [Bacteroidia bacterium]